MADVHELVERAKAGDRQAFTGLYDQFAPLVRSVAYDTTGSLHEAEDLCQDVFLQAYRNLGQLRDATRFAGWLVMIARRACASWRRTRRRRAEVDIEGPATPCDPPEPVGDEIERLLDVMGRLPPQERMALHLFYLAERPASLARQTMGLSNAGFYQGQAQSA